MAVRISRSRSPMGGLPCIMLLNYSALKAIKTPEKQIQSYIYNQ
jgi:hypothetical protein